MPDPDDIRDAPSIAPAFAACLKVYRHLCLSLTRPDCRVADQVDVSEVCDNYGRLNVWGSDSGTLRTGRGSLDDVLRTNESLRSIVLDTISDLTKSIERATLLADVGPTRNEEHLLAGDSDGDSLSSASTTSESFPNGGNRSCSKKGEIQYSFSDIFIHIQSLYKISISLRRPAVHDKYIRSVSKDANKSCFIPHDYRHVESKFRNASEVLVRRLGLANTRRRQQLEYWENHHQDAAEGDLSEAALFDTATPPKKLAIGRPATESNPTRSRGILSRATKQSFSTVPQSLVNDDETFSGRPKTLYEPSLQGTGGYLKVPDRPAVPFGRTSFECPYCHTQLDVQTMQKRQLWKKHVFRDLRPYVCTYEGCLNAEKLYVTRHDWMYHEGQLHQRSWICGNHCDRRFSTPQLLKKHMLDYHLGTFAESQLPILIDMCERQADPDERALCPLCGLKATLRALRTHVASHLEDVALFVLPVETNDQNADAFSDHAEQPLEKDSRFDDDELSTMGSFGEDEDIQPPLQDPKAFETALKKKGEHSLLDVKAWLDFGQEVGSKEGERKDTVQAGSNTAVPGSSTASLEEEDIQEPADSANRRWHKGWPLSKYRSVQVLLVQWEDEDLGVDDEVAKLAAVFSSTHPKGYNYHTQRYSIPNEEPEDQLTLRLLDFRKGATEEDLLILYYAGHATGSAQECIWSGKHDYNSPSLDWHSVQGPLLGSPADVLLILDCCFATLAARNYGKGDNWMLGASNKETKATGVARNSFTSTLTRELKRCADKYWKRHQTLSAQSLDHAFVVWERDLDFTPKLTRLTDHDCPATDLTPLLYPCQGPKMQSVRTEPPPQPRPQSDTSSLTARLKSSSTRGSQNLIAAVGLGVSEFE